MLDETMNPSQSFAWFLLHHLAFENEECPFPILNDPVFCDALAPKLHIFGSFPILKSQALLIFILQLLQHQFSDRKNPISDGGIFFWTKISDHLHLGSATAAGPVSKK